MIAYGSGFDSGLECWSGYGAQGTGGIFPCQCPLCGCFGFGSLDGGRRTTHSHVCFEECAVAEMYDVLDHFNQDYRNPGDSPAVSLAREAAKSARFESAEWLDSLDGIILSVKRLTEQRVFCAPGEYAKILAQAQEWAADKPTEPYMRYNAPWWVQHRVDMLAGVLPCSCYSCISDAERVTAAK